MSKRSYSTAARRAERKAVEFDIDGETFWTVPVPPAGALGAISRGALDERPAAGAVAVFDWFDMVLEPESSERLAAKLKDPNSGVDDVLLLQIFRDLLEELSGRPTTAPSDSPDGSSTDGTSSTGAAPATVSTP